MVNYRKILQLDADRNVSVRDLLSSAHCSYHSYTSTIEATKAKGISWPLDDDMINEELQESGPGFCPHPLWLKWHQNRGAERPVQAIMREVGIHIQVNICFLDSWISNGIMCCGFYLLSFFLHQRLLF